MSEQCKFYENHELGLIGDLEYKKHVQSCELCISLQAEDAKLLELACGLKQPVNPDNIWENIEAGLCKKRSKNAVLAVFMSNKMIFRIAAVLVIGAVIGFYFTQYKQIPDKGVVTLSMLEKLDEKELSELINKLQEQNYIKVNQGNVTYKLPKQP